MKALLYGQVIAESKDTVLVEGNHYFPLGSIHEEYLRKSDLKTTCFWKGEASYYIVEIDGQTADNAAWYYADPSEKAKSIKNHVAFGGPIKVIES